MKDVYSLTPFTMQDYPGHTACIVWLSGCNLRCPYCHNPDIVNNAIGTYGIEKVKEFLNNRLNKLDGVVITGGEATLYPDLQELCEYIKTLGFKIKLDTNGTNCYIVRELLRKKLIDYIALDYKAPPYKFKKVTGRDKYNAFVETLDFLIYQKEVPFEIRTTVHTDLLNEDDVQYIIDDLSKRDCKAPHFIQNYMHTETLGALDNQSNQLDVNKLDGSVCYRNFKEKK